MSCPTALAAASTSRPVARARSGGGLAGAGIAAVWDVTGSSLTVDLIRPVRREPAYMARASSTGTVAAAMLALAVAGCGGEPGTTSGRVVTSHAQAARVKAGAAVPVTGARLSALMAGPPGFTRNRNRRR